MSIIGTTDIQIQLEEEQRGKKLNSYLREINSAIIGGRLHETREGQLLVKLGFFSLVEKIEEYFEADLKGQHSKDRNFLQLLSDDPKVIAFISLSTIVSLSALSSATVTVTAKAILNNLKNIHFFDRLKRDNPKLHSYLGMAYKRASAKRKRMLVTKHIKELYHLDFNGKEGSLSLRLGTLLIDLLLKTNLGIIELEKTFQHTHKMTKKRYNVRLTAEASKILIDFADVESIMLKSNMLPMVVVPNDWKSYDNGGYLTHRIPFVKATAGQHKRWLLKQDFSKVFNVINKLQKTSWRVNKNVLNVMYDIFESNMIDPKGVPTLPRCYGGIPANKKYEAEDLIPPAPEYDESNKEEWHQWNKKRESVQIDLDAEYSRRLGFTFALDVAQKMIDYEKFYYVYQVDYRGRVYSHNEFLNPQSKSYIKAMLEFGEGDYLNEEGVYWLKVHTANCYGLDKAPFSERIKFVDDNMSLLLEIADDPLASMKDWAYSDSPYEYLACAFAWKDYQQGNKVHLPIQLDATCSGIQIYSGLLLDREGALSVNVVGNTRQDIYQKVADKVNEKLETGDYLKVVEFTDSEGVEKSLFTFKEAESLKGNISRSVTKRNTMTVPYSVTLRGMQDQNHDYMHKCTLEGKEFWKGDRWVVNKLITDLNYRSIYEVIQGAKLGQDYLKELASTLGEVATWYTPIFEFPVLQPAYKVESVRVRTPLGRLEIFQKTKGVNKTKQGSSIAANYIHSIDSTLLLYCIREMSKDIGVIHDCFLVHPNDGEEIRKHFREGYIEIMKLSPLKLLGKQLDPDGNIEVPCVGTLDLEEVRDAEYILS